MSHDPVPSFVGMESEATILKQLRQGRLTEAEKTKSCRCTILQNSKIFPPYNRRSAPCDIARERGPGALAKIIMSQQERDIDAVQVFSLNDDVHTSMMHLSGARDILRG